MKNFIVALMLLISGTTSFANASCLNGSCSNEPVRNIGKATVNVTKRVVTYPFKVVKQARTNRLNSR